MITIKNVRELAAILDQYGLTRIEAHEDCIIIERTQKIDTHLEKNKELHVSSNEFAVSDESIDLNNILEIRSPIVGVFYSAASPESSPFVIIGSKVKKGDVLCIIEAMKLMNEITAENDGEIIDICLKNGDLAEYGQVLFKLAEKNGGETFE